MERTQKVYETYDRETGEFYFKAICPFCKKHTKLSGGEITERCRHFVNERHGCGGTIFVFKKEEAA